MAKKFVYHGLDLDTLSKLSFEDFLKLVPSNHRRTLRRHGTQVKKFLEQLDRAKKNGKKEMRTQIREMVVTPAMLGMTFFVHNGKEWTRVEATLERLGRRLGEYSIPIKLVKHSGPGIGATRGSKSIELK